MANDNGGPLLVVKRWQALLVLVGWLVSCIWMVAIMYARTNQNAAEIEEMKRDHVTKDRFEESQQDIQRRLQRIEDKLDRDRALRSLH